jgi:AcrR family transcriptional regulator
MAGEEVTSEAGHGARAPRQRRGRARVDAILDAAAALVAQEGVAGVTMHALARRARTSIGSLYHFFPDRDSVLEALRGRHAAAIRAISLRLGETPAGDWRALSAEAAIERLLRPFVEYLQGHADFLPLMGWRQGRENEADFVRMIGRVLNARLPGLDARAREEHALMLHAIASGTMHAGLQADPGRAELYLREIPRVLAAYLAVVEADAGA